MARFEMSWLHQIGRRWRFLFRRAEFERGMDEEMRLHLEMKAREFVAVGMSAEEARYAALRSFGNVPLLKEDSRDVWGWRWLEDLFQDLRFSARLLAKSPGFTLVVVLSLALGIGANTAIFSLIDAIMLKMLPVKNPEQLQTLNWAYHASAWPEGLWHSYSTGPCPHETEFTLGCSFSYPTFEDIRAQNEVFSHVFALTGAGPLNLSLNGHAALVQGEFVSGDYFSGLGVQALSGRTFTGDDDKPSASPVAVVSYGYWGRRFGRDPAVVGKVVTLNGVPFTIVGVTPPEFFGAEPGRSPEVWIPLRMEPLVNAARWFQPEKSPFNQRDHWWLRIMGRLKPGVSEQQARAALDVIFRQSITAGLASPPKPEKLPWIWLVPGGKGIETLRREFSKPLFVLMTVVGLVLLIACANVANLLLARATTRQKEIAVRSALGAGRRRLIRQLLTESVLLAFVGGGVGLLMAYWGTRLLVGLMTTSWLSINLDTRPDWRVLSFTTTVSVLTGLLFGLAPALQSTRVNLVPALKENPGNLVAGTRPIGKVRLGLAKGLVISQVATSLLLLIGAGLFVRTLVNLETLDVGFNRRNLLLFGIDPTLSGYKGQRLANLYRELQERLQALPGVKSVSLSQHSLISGSYNSNDISIEGYKPRLGEDMEAATLSVAPRFFETMGIPLLLGRTIGPQDNESAPKVAVINQAMARRFFPGENPVGKRFSWGDGKKGYDIEIIGVVRDAKYHQVRGEAPPTVYVPYSQKLDWLGPMHFEVRTAGDPHDWIPAVRQMMQSVEENVPLFDVKTQTEEIDETLFQERLFAKLTSFFGLLALLLACIGLYGIMAYAVVRRTNEIGIRMALGAQRSDVLGMVLGESLLLVTVGIALGLPVALAATRLLKSFLFGLTPNDPVAIVASILLMAAVAAFAGYLPARRASRVDPMVALRYE